MLDRQYTLIYFNTFWLAILLRVTDSRSAAAPEQRSTIMSPCFILMLYG
jgi:hypothetical protein